MSSKKLQLKNPIVLVHGLGAKDRFGPIDYFFKIPGWLRAAGNTVLTPSLTSFQRVDERAKELKEQIIAAYPDPSVKVNVVGHSMGGLDARYIASRLDFSDRIASVTTVGTPNKGTPVSELGLEMISDGGKRRIQALFEMMGQSFEPYQMLSPKRMIEEFNTEVIDAPGVSYFSATSVIKDPIFTALPVFWLSHRYVRKLEGENDGFVSLESAKWGEHIVTDFGDHYAQIGQPVGFSRGLDVFKFFGSIFRRLHDAGF